MAHDWLKTEIVTGLQKLLALRLQGSPAADTAAVTAEVWITSIIFRPVDWKEELDRLRVRAAFGVLIERCDRWPAPRHFFEALQPRSYTQPQLPKKMSDVEMRRSREKVKQIALRFASRFNH